MCTVLSLGHVSAPAAPLLQAVINEGHKEERKETKGGTAAAGGSRGHPNGSRHQGPEERRRRTYRRCALSASPSRGSRRIACVATVSPGSHGGRSYGLPVWQRTGLLYRPVVASNRGFEHACADDPGSAEPDGGDVRRDDRPAQCRPCEPTQASSPTPADRAGRVAGESSRSGYPKPTANGSATRLSPTFPANRKYHPLHTAFTT